MPRRVKWSVCDYKDEDFNNQIDYSEVRTEPGLVLSMRDIFRRYAAQGINLLEQEVPDDDGVMDVDIDDVFEMSDLTDVLHHQQQVGSRRVSKVVTPESEESEDPEDPSGHAAPEHMPLKKRQRPQMISRKINVRAPLSLNHLLRRCVIRVLANGAIRSRTYYGDERMLGAKSTV